MKKRRKRHAPEQVVKKLRDADAMLITGKSLEEVLEELEVGEATLARWRSQYGGMKSEEAKRLKELEGENARLRRPQAEVETQGNNRKLYLSNSLVWTTGTLLVSEPQTRRSSGLFLAHIDALRGRL